jgi:hypothetical protein
MADYLVTDLEDAVRRELRDNDSTQWEDAEMIHYINDAVRYVADLVRKYNKYSPVVESNTRYFLMFDEFSYENEHDLPENFYWPIRIKKVGGTAPIRKVNLDLIDDTDSVTTPLGTEARYMIRGSRVGAPVPNSANSGDNLLMTYDNGYSATEDRTYTITMTGAAAFDWSGSGAGGSGSGTVTTAKEFVTLEDGVQISLGSLTGAVSGDVYTFAAKYTYEIQILRLNYDPDTNLEAEYVRYPTKIELSGGALPTTVYLPFRRYFFPMKEYVKLRCLNSNEMQVTVDAQLMAPVESLVMDVCSDIADDDNGDVCPAYGALDML